jgi:hypothetical protein
MWIFCVRVGLRWLPVWIVDSKLLFISALKKCENSDAYLVIFEEYKDNML